MGQQAGWLLLVDDDADTLAVLRELLEAEGYSVETATNGSEALAVLQRKTGPCAILLDLMMPVMDGWQFLQIKNGDAHLASIPVIVISAHQQQMAVGGVVDFLPKPIDFDRLVTEVRHRCAAPPPTGSQRHRGEV